MTNVALVDVKNLDGEVWDVAKAAGQQVQDGLELSQEALEGLIWAARGAWLSQEEYRQGRMPTLDEFEQSALGIKLLNLRNVLLSAQKEVRVATAAAAFDPRSF